MNQNSRRLFVVLLIAAAFSTGTQVAEEPAAAAGPKGIAELADLCLTTTLVEDGQQKCVIVIPSTLLPSRNRQKMIRFVRTV